MDNTSNSSVKDFPKVSVIILNWNGEPYIENCLDSVLNSDYPKEVFEVIVVDNRSSDNSVALIKNNYPEVILIENKKNLGFCEGNNIGIKRAKGAIIILLNNDTIVERNWVQEIVKMAIDPDVGVIGCKLYFYGTKILQTNGFRMVFLGRWESIGAGETDEGQFDHIKEVDFVSGAALAIKFEVIEKIGLLDTKFHSYIEDLDWCYRARKAGYKVVISKGIVYHHGSISWDRFPFKKIYLSERNRLYFIRKHYRPKILLRYLSNNLIRGLIFDLKRFMQNETVIQKTSDSKESPHKRNITSKGVKMITLKYFSFLVALLWLIKKRKDNVQAY